MRLQTWIFIVTFVVSLSVQAEPKISKLEKGKKAPYSGLLINKEQSAKFRQTNEENKLLNTKVLKLEQLRVVQKDSTEFYKERYRSTKKDLEIAETKSFFKSTLFFFGGVGITTLITFAVLRTTR